MSKTVIKAGQINNLHYEVILDEWTMRDGKRSTTYSVKIYTGTYNYNGKDVREYALRLAGDLPETLAAIAKQALAVSAALPAAEEVEPEEVETPSLESMSTADELPF